MAVDLLDSELYRSDPYPAFAEMRKNSPVHWDDKHGVWLVTRWNDVVRVARNADLFCSGQGIRPNDDTKAGIVTTDEPRHGQLRRLVSRGFTPEMVARHEPRIRKVAVEAIEAVESAGKCDFVSDLAAELSLRVMAGVLGIMREHRAMFREWSQDIIAGDGQPPGTAGYERGRSARADLAEYLRAVVAERKEQPRGDVISALTRASQEGLLDTDPKELGEDELIGFLLLLLIAGIDTTRNAMSAGMVAFSAYRDQWRRLRDDPGLLPSAVEEILRWSTPMINTRRTATRATELGGQEIAQGDQVVIFFASANRDEEVFTLPNEFRVDRDPNPHVSFGAGVHFCLGADLARLEIRILFEELMRRLPDIRLAPGTQPVYGASAVVREISELPVVFGSPAA